jgi:type I restriction enzyme R subunit
MLYEIISPDEFLRDYLDDYASLAAIYDVVRIAYTRRVSVDRDVLRKTNRLVQDHIGSYDVETVNEFIRIDERTIEAIKEQQGGDATKVINLIKLIEKTAEEESGDPFLIAMAERAKAIQESYEDRQLSTSEALKTLIGTVEADQERQKRQAERGIDGITYFTLAKLTDVDFPNAELVAGKVGAAFVEHPYWRISETAMRDVRQQVTFALFNEEDDFGRVARLVGEIFSVLQKVDSH